MTSQILDPIKERSKFVGYESLKMKEQLDNQEIELKLTTYNPTDLMYNNLKYLSQKSSTKGKMTPLKMASSL